MVNELERLSNIRLHEVSPGHGHSQGGADFFRASSAQSRGFVATGRVRRSLLGRVSPRGDSPVLKSILADSTPAFREIQGNAAGGSADLPVEVAVPAAELFHRAAERLNCCDAVLESLKAHMRLLSFFVLRPKAEDEK